jgi:hypothetical protein
MINRRPVSISAITTRAELILGNHPLHSPVGGELQIHSRNQHVSPTHSTNPTPFINRKALWGIACVGYVGLIWSLLPPTPPLRVVFHIVSTWKFLEI